MAKLLMFILLFVLLSCGRKVEQTQSFPVLSPQSFNKLTKMVHEENMSAKLSRSGQAVRTKNSSSFIAIVPPSSMEKAKELLSHDPTSKIIYADAQAGYLHFTSKASVALELATHVAQTMAFDYKIPVEKKLLYQEQGDTKISYSDREEIYPQHIMNNKALTELFEKEYGQKLDASKVTVVVADTGLDITRTDAFQDRIIGLYSVRPQDRATLTKATLTTINGKEYFYAKINGKEVKIEKSERLKEPRDYYLGYFTEEQFKTKNKSYKYFHFSQSELPHVIFPIIIYYNDSRGRFEGYINVNNAETYGSEGDYSIEDERLLIDFNLSSTLPANERYEINKTAGSLSSNYRYTTRLDLVSENSDTLTKDRSKGSVNMAILLREGTEVASDGKSLVQDGLSLEKEPIYHVGLSGFDVNGHGTHVAGLAAGHFESAPEYSSMAFNAKIVGITFLDGGSRGDLFDTISKVVQRYPNTVFNFSFGANDEENDSQDEVAKIQEAIIRTYGAILVVAAGNEGPGLKSHGLTHTESTISVANYFSSVSRNVEASTVLPDHKFSLSTSSSRGPLADGLLKPDIGAPGWAYSSLPLSKDHSMRSSNSFEYFEGTSMATPNAVSVVALLMDAAIKSHLVEEQQNRPALSADKVLRALQNGAAPYSPRHYFDCFSKGVHSVYPCQLTEHIENVSWIMGGAGRIDALGAWKALKQIAHRPQTFYNLSTTMLVNGSFAQSKGHFSYNDIASSFNIQISLGNPGDVLNDKNRHQELLLKIPQEISWLSFHPTQMKKERIVNIFGGSKGATVTVFIHQEQLMENGRLKAGVHTAIIKGYAKESPDVFDLAFPVTIVGNHTQFDHLNDGYQFSAQGFLPNDTYVSYFFPVEDNEVVTVDADVSMMQPGDLFVSVYRNGMELPLSELQNSFMFISSRPDFGGGRNHLRYYLKGQKAGNFEVVIFSGSDAAYSYKDMEGSFYSLHITRNKIDLSDITLEETKKGLNVHLLKMANKGPVIRIDAIEAKATAYYRSEEVELKPEATPTPITKPFEIFDTVNAQKVKTICHDSENSSVTLEILDSNKKVVASSKSSSLWHTLYEKLPAGSYELVITPVKIDHPITMTLQLTQYLSNYELLTDEFTIEGGKTLIGSDFRMRPHREYNLVATIPPTTLQNIVKSGYDLMMAVTIWELIGNNNEPASILRKTFLYRK